MRQQESHLDRCQRDASGCKVLVYPLQLLGPIVGHSHSLNQPLAAPRPASDIETPSPGIRANIEWVKGVCCFWQNACTDACPQHETGTSCGQLHLLRDAGPL